jgi:hypothetical protein
LVLLSQKILRFLQKYHLLIFFIKSPPLDTILSESEHQQCEREQRV